MTDAVTHAIKKIRGQLRPKEPPPTQFEIDLASVQAQNNKVQMWERDKKIKRDQNFAKALIGLEQYREGQRQEKERQQDIAEARLKNLAKARRALKKIRSSDD